MPTYEYVCKKCGHEFEARHSIAAPALKTCPEDLCAKKKWGRGQVTKKISAGTGLLFKGGGFYITDYRSEGYKSAAKKDVAPAKSEAKSEPKSDSKPAPKPGKK
ncbi:MAG TPA: zinc ribbon domain-containing protein [Verrucomicrobiae bacterium]|jgi:putative FmdB family regulatory protein